MMVPMEIALVICLVAAVAALTWLLARRNPPVVVREVEAPTPGISADVISQAAMLAVEQAVTMSREQLGAHTQATDASLAGRQQLIDQRLGKYRPGCALTSTGSQLVALGQPHPSGSARWIAPCRSPEITRCCRAPPTACARRGQLQRLRQWG